MRPRGFGSAFLGCGFASLPLLAPPEGLLWDILWSSEAPEYGGCGTPPLETADNWRIPGHAAVLLRPVEPAKVAWQI